MITLYVIRHGETDWNIQARMQGHTDIPLNTTGQKQAQIAAKELKNLHFDLIISSPLSRAIDTAKYINASKNTQIITDERIIERSFGDLEGKTNSIFSELGFSIQELLDYSTNYDKYNIETVKDLFTRIELFINDIKEKYPNKTILISTHNGIAQVMDIILNNLPKTTNLLDVSFKNCEHRRYVIYD